MRLIAEDLMNIDYILGSSFMVGLVIATVGAWFLMRALRTASSKVLVVSLFVFLNWIFFSRTLFFYLFSYFDTTQPPPFTSALAAIVEIVAPAFLVLVIAVSFLWSSIQVGKQGRAK